MRGTVNTSSAQLPSHYGHAAFLCAARSPGSTVSQRVFCNTEAHHMSATLKLKEQPSAPCPLVGQSRIPRVMKSQLPNNQFINTLEVNSHFLSHFSYSASLDDLPNKLLSHSPYLRLYFQKNPQLRSDAVRIQTEVAWHQCPRF